MTLLALGIGALALIGGMLVLLRRPERSGSPDDRDEETLEEAEREVRDLGAMTSPDEADDELTDWGPGAPS
jgi:hypothetical protein